ncbi:hypothetical protein ACFVT2_41095 [Streptomyces sp. NPDC058000]|uniref:hypothetical protein n=1 Tax=Streptomyces sp. NPDC058000 TaxID=3346299 RepID=UPI0036EBD2EB
MLTLAALVAAGPPAHAADPCTVEGSTWTCLNGIPANTTVTANGRTAVNVTGTVAGTLNATTSGACNVNITIPHQLPGVRHIPRRHRQPERVEDRPAGHRVHQQRRLPR